MVLAGDLDVAAGLVAHRMIAAVMSERQLERLAAECPAEQLMAEADPEDRHLAEQLGDRVDGVADHRRVARAVRQEHAVGLAAPGRRRRGRGRHDLDGAETRQVAQHRPLDAEVEGDDPSRCAAGRPVVYGDAQVTSATRSMPSVPGSAAAAAAQRRFVGGSERAGHRPGVAQDPGEPAGVDPADRR